MPPDEIGAAAKRARQPGRRGAPLVDREHRARRPADPRPVRDDRPGHRPRHARRDLRLLGARGGRVPRRRPPPGLGRRLHRAPLRARRDRRARRRHHADRGRRERARRSRSSTPRSRRTSSSSTSTPAPATRTPVRTRCPTAGGCWCATSTRWRCRTSRGAPRSAPTSRTPTSRSRSCSTGWTCKVNDWGTTVTDPVDYLQPRRGRAGSSTRPAARSPRCPSSELDDVRASVKRGAEGSLPPDRGHEPAREDRRGRVRVLHVPAPVRARRRASTTTSTGPCRATASTSTKRCR